MTAAQPLPMPPATLPLPIPAHGEWTADDLDRLPEQYRYEIVDGALLMTPSALPDHNEISLVLAWTLRSSCPPGLSAITETDVILTDDERNVRRPDVVVYRRERGHEKLHAEDVVLALEVVSAGSTTEDRVTKPAVYATAGIPHYWRVEMKPTLTVVEYRLTELGRYYEHSPRAGVITVAEPWPIKVDLDVVAREAGLA